MKRKTLSLVLVMLLLLSALSGCAETGAEPASTGESIPAAA